MKVVRVQGSGFRVQGRQVHHTLGWQLNCHPNHGRLSLAGEGRLGGPYQAHQRKRRDDDAVRNLAAPDHGRHLVEQILLHLDGFKRIRPRLARATTTVGGK